MSPPTTLVAHIRGVSRHHAKLEVQVASVASSAVNRPQTQGRQPSHSLPTKITRRVGVEVRRRPSQRLNTSRRVSLPRASPASPRAARQPS